MTERAGSTAPTGSAGRPTLDDALLALEAAIGVIAEADLSLLVSLDGPSIGLHDAARRVEQARRRLGAFDAAYVAAVEAGDEPRRYHCSSTATFLRDQLGLSLAEARRRVRLSQVLSTRPGFSGDPLPPVLPLLAAAMAAGLVSSEQAAVVADVMDALPDPVRVEHGDVVEAELVAAAVVCDPGQLARLGRDVIERADPDGALRDFDYAHAHRGITVTAHRNRPGGSIRGDLDVEALEKLQVIFDSLARPEPTIETADGAGLPDRRSPAARRHDALVQALDVVLSGDSLPAAGGAPTTVVIHLTKEQYSARRGLAITAHGNTIPVKQALAMADQAEVFTLVRNTRNVPLALGRSVRIATPGQTIALAGRDRGCTAPGCDRPPAYCQRHHVRSWQDGGATDIDNLVLLCGYHHRAFERAGWSLAMKDGLPWWTPPRWMDPEQKPVRNTMHRRLPDTG